MSQVKILAFAGSTRKGSWNKKALKVAATGAESAGAQVTILDLSDLDIPLYNGDREEKEGLPQSIKDIKKLMLNHDGFIIASPEYNSSITPLLKNVIDWTSRPENDQEASLACYKDKAAVLVSASPGILGGLRALREVRSILTSIGVVVLPAQHAISKAHEAFNEEGSLNEERAQKKVVGLGELLVAFLKKMRA